MRPPQACYRRYTSANVIELLLPLVWSKPVGELYPACISFLWSTGPTYFCSKLSPCTRMWFKPSMRLACTRTWFDFFDDADRKLTITSSSGRRQVNIMSPSIIPATTNIQYQECIVVIRRGIFLHGQTLAFVGILRKILVIIIGEQRDTKE